MIKLNKQVVMFFMTAFFCVGNIVGQSGFVKAEGGEPVSDVKVLIKDKLLATTDAKGQFIITPSLPLPIKISIEHPDFQPKDSKFKTDGQTFYLISKREELGTVILNIPSFAKTPTIIPTSRITAQALSQQSPVSIVDAINQTAGIYIQSGAINTNRITIRGVGSRTLYGTNKLKAYFDGFPITNGVGETALDIYNPEDLSTIEIIKGPKATLYGTNLGGTILLNSKRNTTSGLNVENSFTAGSFGLLKNSLSTNFSYGKFNVHLVYDHLEKDGFRDNSGYNRNSYFLNSDYRISANTDVGILLNASKYTAFIPSSLGKTDFIKNPSTASFTWGKAKGYENDKSMLVGISINHQFSESFENQTRLFYKYSEHYEPRPFNILDEFTNGLGLRTMFTKTFLFLNGNVVWNFGTEIYQDKYRWKTIENRYEENNGNGSLEGELLSQNVEHRNQINVFSNLELPLSQQLKMELGVNFNSTHYDFSDIYQTGPFPKSAQRNFEPIFAPNLNFTYEFAPEKHIFLNMGYGFNFPSLEEALTPEGIVNPEIDPETGYNYELGAEIYAFNRSFHLLTSVYILDIKNLLVAQRVGDDQYIGRNAGRTLQNGLEVSMDYKLPLSKVFLLSPYINATFNWHRFENFVSEANDYSGNKLTGVPNATLASGLAIKYRKLSFFINHLYVGELPMNDNNSLFSDSYNLLNFKVNYNLSLSNNFNLNLNVGINNVMNTTYASSILINATGFNNAEPRYYYPGEPRNYYCGIKLHYHF